MAAGDPNLHHLDGLALFDEADVADLPDALHPNGDGYVRMGERFAALAFAPGRAVRPLTCGNRARGHPDAPGSDCGPTRAGGRAMIVRKLAGVMAVATAIVASGSGSAGAAPQSGRPPVGRVLIVSLPGVSWRDLAGHGLPNLHRVLDGAGVADLSTRAPFLVTDLAGNYASLSAGDKAVGAARRRRGVRHLSRGRRVRR